MPANMAAPATLVLGAALSAVGLGVIGGGGGAPSAAVKAALVALDGAIHAARGTLLIADAAALTGAPVAVDDLARQVAAVLDAAVTLQRLTAPKAVAPLLPQRAPPVAPSAPVALPAKGGAS